MKDLIDNNLIDSRAINIVDVIQQAGYEAYIVGGCLRDLLLGFTPKDFDIATSARPEEVAALFKNCRIIGKRFRLAHIYFGRDIFEVATFRRDAEINEQVQGDNCYGTIEDDVKRRDFSINSLYYDPIKKELIDKLDALGDLSNRQIRIIGDADIRYEEDPVRILRALRFIAKLNMKLELETSAAIPKNKKNLLQVPPARLLDECQKLFLGGYSSSCFEQLREYQVFSILFPDVERALNHKNKAFAEYSLKLIQLALKNSDERIQKNKTVTLAFVFAAFFWPVFQLQYKGMLKEHNWFEALNASIDLVLIAANERVSVPMRLRAMIGEMWSLQARLELAINSKRKVRNVLENKRFRAAYDLLLLRCEAGENLHHLVDFWTKVQ